MPPKAPKTRVTPIRKEPISQQFKRMDIAKLRATTLARDNFICQSCYEPYPEHLLESDHVIPLSKGGNDDITNTQTLCKPCHVIKTNRGE